MASSTPPSAQRALLREAASAARAGDRSEAERLYRRVLDQDPESVEAWLGMGTVVQEPSEKAACFRRVLELDPANEDAAASLQRLQAVLPSGHEEPLFCAFHPQVETVLRCSQCGRPICVRCSHPYPVGQLCPDCVRGRRPLVYQAGLAHLAASGTATLAASFLAGLLWSVVGWSWILAILIGPMVGSGLAQVALWAGRRRRGLAVQITAAACIVVGILLGALALGAVFFGGRLLSDLGFLVYVALAVGSAVTWLR